MCVCVCVCLCVSVCVCVCVCVGIPVTRPGEPVGMWAMDRIRAAIRAPASRISLSHLNAAIIVPSDAPESNQLAEDSQDIARATLRPLSQSEGRVDVCLIVVYPLVVRTSPPRFAALPIARSRTIGTPFSLRFFFSTHHPFFLWFLRFHLLRMFSAQV